MTVCILYLEGRQCSPVFRFVQKDIVPIWSWSQGQYPQEQLISDTKKKKIYKLAPQPLTVALSPARCDETFSWT